MPWQARSSLPYSKRSWSRVCAYAVWRRLRSGSAANKPFASKIRMASERDGWPGTRLRHSSMSSSQRSWSRRLTTFAQSADDRASFRVPIAESDMQRVLQQSAHAENPVYEKTDDKLPTGAPFVALRLQYFSVDRLTDKARGASAWPAQYETFCGRWSIRRDERKQPYSFSPV